MRRAAFTLYELMFAVALVGVVLAVAEPLGRRAARVLAGETSTASADAALDRAVDDLRRDVWRATAVRAADAHHLTLSFADGRARERTIGGTDGLPAGCTVAVDGAVVHLTVPTSTGFRGGQVDLVAAVPAVGEP